MDAVSYSHADKQKQRIEKFIKQPDSTSGIVTVPDTIASGESIEIATGRQIVVDHLDVQGTLDIQGTLATVSGGYLSQTTMKTQAIAHTNGTNAMTIDSSGNVMLGSNYLTPYTGFKNYIINGNFDVWQRGTYFPSCPDQYTSDRWFVFQTGTRCIVQNDTSQNGLQIVGTAGNTKITIGQQIESNGATVGFLGGKTVTISGRIWSQTSRNISIVPWYKTVMNDIYFNSRVAIASYSLSLTAGVNSFSYTITLPASASNGIQIEFQADNFVSGDSISIYEVQLEEGSVATPFENRPYGLELSLCQRYYETGTGYGLSYASSAAAYQRSIVMYSVSKRLPPAIVVTKLGGVATAPSIGYSTNTMFVVTFSSVGASEELYYSYTASAEL